jgi:hypothetical protein
MVAAICIADGPAGLGVTTVFTPVAGVGFTPSEVTTTIFGCGVADGSEKADPHATTPSVAASSSTPLISRA